MAASDEIAELRGNCPRTVIDVLDAVSQARRMTRIELVNEVLKTWARGVVHQANVVQRVTRGNTGLTDSEWGGVEP